MCAASSLRGSSGAAITLSGDWVLKSCQDAEEQCDWLRIASGLPVVSGIRIPVAQPISNDEYRIEFLHGIIGTRAQSTGLLDALLEQVRAWSLVPAGRTANWQDYKSRLWHQHVLVSNSAAMRAAWEVIDAMPALPSSWAHGDLTLENVVVGTDGRAALLDPNYKRDLFQSHVLDLGKLLQSVHADYHRRFQSNAGDNPEAMCAHLRAKLSPLVWAQAARAELSHIMRLRKYRPAEEHAAVDGLLSELIEEMQ